MVREDGDGSQKLWIYTRFKRSMEYSVRYRTCHQIIIMILNILGYPYKLDMSKELKDMGGNVGYCHFDKLTLDIAKDVPVDVFNSTLLHEIIEAINYHLEIELTEAQIKQLETGLHPLVSTAMSSIKEQYGRCTGKSI